MNYAENAAVASDIALDTKPGSSYSKLLESRAYKKNEADQRGKSVRQMKKESKEETVTNRYGGGETPAAYLQKLQLLELLLMKKIKRTLVLKVKKL